MGGKYLQESFSYPQISTSCSQSCCKYLRCFLQIIMPILTIATGDDVVVLRESGGLWNGTRHLEGARVHRLASYHHEGNNILYAASLGEGVWCSRDDGVRWSNGATRLPGSRVWSVATGEDGALYAGGEAGMLQRSQNDGLIWETLGNLWLVTSSASWQTPLITVVAPNPQHADWMLCAVENHGVLFSNDGGFSWDDVRPGAPKDVHSLVWHRHDPAIVLAVAPRALALSQDGGWSWREMSWEDKSGQSQSDVVWQSANCDDEGQWWLIGHGIDSENSASSVPQQTRGKSVVWRADAERARRISDHPQRESELRAVACAGEMCALGWQDGAISISRDGGNNWQQIVIEGAQPQSVQAMILNDEKIVAVQSTDE